MPDMVVQGITFKGTKGQTLFTSTNEIQKKGWAQPGVCAAASAMWCKLVSNHKPDASDPMKWEKPVVLQFQDKWNKGEYQVKKISSQPGPAAAPKTNFLAVGNDGVIEALERLAVAIGLEVVGDPTTITGAGNCKNGSMTVEQALDYVCANAAHYMFDVQGHTMAFRTSGKLCWYDAESGCHAYSNASDLKSDALRIYKFYVSSKKPVCIVAVRAATQSAPHGTVTFHT